MCRVHCNVSDGKGPAYTREAGWMQQEHRIYHPADTECLHPAETEVIRQTLEPLKSMTTNG